MEQILNKKNIIISKEKFKNAKQVFEYLADLAFFQGYTNDRKKLVQAFIEREKEGTTGFENFVAIPHALTEAIVKTRIYIILLKNAVKWKTLDETNKVKFVIALLVPKSKRNKIHLSILSKTAQKLMDENSILALKKYDKEKIYNIFK